MTFTKCQNQIQGGFTVETGHCDDCVFVKRQRGHWRCTLREEEVSQEWVCGHFLSEYEAPQRQCCFSQTPPPKQRFFPGDTAAVATILLGLAIGIGFCVWGYFQ